MTLGGPKKGPKKCLLGPLLMAPYILTRGPPEGGRLSTCIFFLENFSNRKGPFSKIFSRDFFQTNGVNMRATVKNRNDRAKRGANLQFIANYLYKNPGARVTYVLNALCRHRGKPEKRGMYTRYFSSSWTIEKKYRYPGRYWKKSGHGWILTLEGMGLVTET